MFRIWKVSWESHDDPEWCRALEYFRIWICEELTHWKRLWCWDGLGAGGEEDDRGWDGWMASLTWWTWVWVNSGSWWWTGRPGVLRFMGSQRVGHDWVTDLIWTVSRWQVCPIGSWCHCETTSLSLWCPFSPLPIVTCYLRSPRHMCTSLEQGYNCYCLQEVCSVFSVFK